MVGSRGEERLNHSDDGRCDTVCDRHALLRGDRRRCAAECWRGQNRVSGSAGDLAPGEITRGDSGSHLDGEALRGGAEGLGGGGETFSIPHIKAPSSRRCGVIECRGDNNQCRTHWSGVPESTPVDSSMVSQRGPCWMPYRICSISQKFIVSLPLETLVLKSPSDRIAESGYLYGSAFVASLPAS